MYSASHSPTATSFTVPDMTDMFFKCDPGLASMTPLQRNASKVVLPQHSHGGKLISSSKNLPITFKSLTLDVRAS